LFHRAEHISEEAAVRKRPVGLFHFHGSRRQPQHAVGAVGAPSVEPALATDLAEAAAQLGHVADEIGEVVALLAEVFPADPAGFVVLAIGVVVTVLRIADLVAGQHQRRALCEEEAGELVLAKLAAQRRDRGIVGRALMAAIIAVVVARAVAVVFAVGLVVLLVVAEQVRQRKTVVDGDMVDAGPRQAVVVMKQVG